MAQAFTVLQLTHFKKIGDNYHRLIWPARELARQAPHWRVINMLAEAEAHYDWAEKADLLVLSQSLDLDLLPVIERRRARGLKTLAEYADNFYEPPLTSTAAGHMSTPLSCQRYELVLEACDAIIVTGPGLRALIGAHFPDKEIHILENHYPETLPEFERRWRPPGESFVVGWGGSAGHVADVLAIMPVLGRVAAARPGLRVHLMGEQGLASHARIPPAQLSFRPWGDIDAYFRFLDGLDLGVVPLMDTPFNRCRSDVKAIEMISRGVLPLLPARLPYEALLQASGLEPYRDAADLEARILHYMDNPEALREDARRLYDYVRAHRVAPLRRERLELYRRMMPAHPATSDWPLPPGYHEVEGPRLQETPSGGILRRFADIGDDGALGEAVACLRRAVEENPAHPDLALRYLTLAARAGVPDWEARLEMAQARFPRDLRFPLLALRLCGEGSRKTRWAGLLERLAALPPAQRAFWEKEATTLMYHHLGRDPGLLEEARGLLALFPGSLPLMQRIALGHEARGEDGAALALFRELADARNLYERNRDYLSRVSAPWLNTWVEILEERLKQTSSRGGKTLEE
ncbi:MAG TPA: hypothetical protein ENK48_03980 [Gammaproteobacteria bacterium]|nr:hypothetical protein [Gammaproteobacteria bacterium]